MLRYYAKTQIDILLSSSYVTIFLAIEYENDFCRSPHHNVIKQLIFQIVISMIRYKNMKNFNFMIDCLIDIDFMINIDEM